MATKVLSSDVCVSVSSVIGRNGRLGAELLGLLDLLVSMLFFGSATSLSSGRVRRGVHARCMHVVSHALCGRMCCCSRIAHPTHPIADGQMSAPRGGQDGSGDHRIVIEAIRAKDFDTFAPLAEHMDPDYTGVFS